MDNEVDQLLGRGASPPCTTKYDPKVWGRGKFVKSWLDQVTDYGKNIPSIDPATALVTKLWKNGNELGEPQLSQFPKGGTEGLLKIIDLNLTIPTFSTSLSKEGIAISLILYADFFLEDRWETVFRNLNSQLKRKSLPVMARRLEYL